MCNAITHPAEREVKMIERFYGKGKGESFRFEVLAQEGQKI